MKRSQNSTASLPPYSPSSSSSSSSSSSICVSGSDPPTRLEKPKPKRAKKNIKTSSEKCQNPSSPSSGRRSSIYRGVTRHRWTGRFEAHLWDKSSCNSIQNKKGKQVYLGAYDSEEAAARTYDLAALKYWGPDTILNFPLKAYTKELEEMQKVSKEEYLASLRRQSSGFSRGVSKYRGVARHHHNGRWEARIGRVFGNKYLYLGTYNTQEEAAAAYDMAAIEYRGVNAVTNFDISNYIDCLKKKGILPFPLNQNQESVLVSSTREAKDEQPEQELEELKRHLLQPEEVNEKLQEEREIEKLRYTDDLRRCTDASTMIAMEPPDNNNNNELAWSFCMDSGLAPFLSDQDFQMDKPMELPDLFDEIGFEDNINFMFEEVNLDCLMLDNTRCRDFGHPDEAVVGGKRLSSASPSSSSDFPSSTTTSISCNYSV